MKTAKFFDTEEELKILTGLSHDELWENGFDLDDWDWGFVSNDYWATWCTARSYEHWILNHMHNYCTGYKIIEYKNRYYYMLYHS